MAILVVNLVVLMVVGLDGPVVVNSSVVVSNHLIAVHMVVHMVVHMAGHMDHVDHHLDHHLDHEHVTWWSVN